MPSWLKWSGLVIVVLTLVIAGSFALFAANLRGTVARLVTERTGRPLVIGDLHWKLDWPQVRLRALDVTFANPSWARERQMLAAAGVDLSIDVPRLLTGTIYLTDVQIERPVLFFEMSADGRKNWLLDQGQQDEDARVSIGRLTLDHGTIGYDDPAQKTRIASEVSTRSPAPGATPGASPEAVIVFRASGQYLGLPLTASGTGGPIIGLRDESTPYRLALAATIGPTSIRAEGTVTGLITHSAVDMKFALRGASLAELFVLLGMALPETRAYNLAGHLTHTTDLWRYDEFSGRIGQSDVAGSLQITSGAARPLLNGDLAFKSLNLADLGPVVGEEGGSAAAQTLRRPRRVADRKAGPGSRALPTVPFSRDRWTSVDADVHIKAQTILRPEALPLEQLTTRLRMRESVLTLDPLEFGAAGGRVVGALRLDGTRNPIQASAKMEVRKLRLAKLLPTVALAKDSIGEINGEIELVGRGDSVGRMLATADGKVGLIINGGKISKLLMEQVVLHVPEIASLKITGDKLVDIHCGVANFNVERGNMIVDALVLDTEVTRIIGTGSVDLEKETLNLTLIPKAKQMSLFALRGPIYLRGELAHPDLELDAGRVGGRGIAALALGAINPALSLIALADPGSGKDANCSALIKQAQAPWGKESPGEKRASGRAPPTN